MLLDYQIKNAEFESLIDGLQERLPEILGQTLADVPKEQRDLLANLVADAFGSLRHSMHSGPDRLGAIKLIFQMSGVMKDPSKTPKSPKSAQSPVFPES